MKEFIRIFTEPFECAGWKALLGVAYIVLSIVAYIVLLGAECNPIVATCAFVNLMLCYYTIRNNDD